MQSSASEKRSVAKSETANVHSLATPVVAEGANWPELMDAAASPATEGLSQRGLLDVCMDLFSKLESSLVTNRQEFIENYFATLIKQDEMSLLWTEPAYYEHLRNVIQKEIVPLYDAYSAIRGKILAKTEKRSWPKFVLWTAGVCLGLELLLTEGRVLRPQALLPAMVVDGFLGYLLYFLINFRDASALKQARRDLLNSIRQIDTRHDVAKRYEVFRTYTGGELLTAELGLLLASYTSPHEFWRDYCLVRQADPTNPEALEKLGIKRFEGFLQLHVNGTYSPEARQQRFNALFLMAHKAFLLNDRENYVLNHLNAKEPH